MVREYHFRCGTFQDFEAFSGAGVIVEVDDGEDIEDRLFDLVSVRVPWLSGEELERAYTDPRLLGARLGICDTSRGCDLVATLLVAKPVDVDDRQLCLFEVV